MPSNERPPVFDERGYNIEDPSDTRGLKTDYITLLQTKALQRYLPQGDGGVAVDIGCGYGRVSQVIQDAGWSVIGVDPDEKQIEYGRRNFAGVDFRVGKLPDLPLDDHSVDLMLMQNVIRILQLMDELDALKGFGRYLQAGARVMVVDNVWKGNEKFVDENWLVELFRDEGLELKSRVPIRAGRWWLLYMIRYGLVPRSRFDAIADYELKLRAQQPNLSSWRYFNVLFNFRRAD
ncbi:MAG: class I SAM-dependent methyltransferase [Woeseiaceae bacterium]|nr:class I SAM-dependent methyltransferase [Woeseiaceae bacterium]